MTINLKHHGMMNLNYLNYYNLWQIFKIIYSNFFKNHGENIDNLSVSIYVNKIRNRITFKIKTGYYLELLTPEIMKLLRSTEDNLTKDKNGENVPHIEIKEVLLVHCDIVNNDYQQDSKPYIHLFQINHLLVVH